MPMGRIARSIGIVLAACMSLPAVAAEAPNFGRTSVTGWIGYGPEYMPVEGAPRPVAADPAHPYIPNAIEYLSARPNLKTVEQSTFPVADLSNPILQPWVRDELRKLNDRVLAGQPVFEHRASCWPSGVPAFVLAVVNPIFFVQTATHVTMISQGGDHTARRVYLNVPHSPNPPPSWFGESVGHYEGDTLVVDTVGVKTDRPYAMQDLFGTPYTDKLHIVERYRLRDYDDVKDAIERNKKENWMFVGDVWSKHRGKFMQVQVTVEDEGVFTAPFTATLTYVPNPGPMDESICAENVHEYYNNKDSDVPKAGKPDF